MKLLITMKIINYEICNNNKFLNFKKFSKKKTKNY